MDKRPRQVSHVKLKCLVNHMSVCKFMTPNVRIHVGPQITDGSKYI